MIHLLWIEWLKIKKYSTFWVLAALFAVLLFSTNWSISEGVMKVGGGDFNVLNHNYTFPEVWGNVAFWTKIFSGLLAIIIIILTTNEYQYRTNRQNVIDGWNRMQFYHAKWGLVVVLSVIVTLYTVLMGLFFAFYHASGTNHMFEHFDKILFVFILTLNYFGFALTLSLMLRRSGMAIIMFLLYAYAIEQILNGLLNMRNPEILPGYFLPMQCSAELLHFPLMDQLARFGPKGPAPLTLCVVSLVWIVIYYVIGRVKLLKSDW